MTGTIKRRRPTVDPYARKNRAALAVADGAPGREGVIDKRIAAALCRRGLMFEDGADCWHLTNKGARVLADIEASDPYSPLDPQPEPNPRALRYAQQAIDEMQRGEDPIPTLSLVIAILQADANELPADEAAALAHDLAEMDDDGGGQ